MSAHRTAAVLVPPSEPDCVRRAAEDLASDTKKITGTKPAIVQRGDDGGIVLVSMDRPESAALLQKLAPGFGDSLKGKWEAYRVETVGPRLLVVGSDERGTMFGLYAFIEKYLGVDPLYYWASRPPKPRSTLAWESVKLSAEEPTFRFRGWFINDEDLLTEFRLDGGRRRIDYPYYHRVLSPSVSARVFEAALRLQMNLVIPSSFVDIRNPAEARLIEDAVQRGLFVSMHHVEPVGVSAFGFANYWTDRGQAVPFAITQQPEKFREIWRDYAERWAKFAPQVVWQLGLRGIADRPVWLADPNVPKSDAGRGKLISDAMAAQWEIIRSVDHRPQPPATTTLWMEGAALHAAGHLAFPQGVAVIFSDNSPGWELQEDFRNVKREPGRDYGIYYHHQLWNQGPHLVQAVSPHKTHSIFTLAVQRRSNHYAMLNVSNVREFVLGLDASARMLRDFAAFDPDKFLAGWCEQRFGAQANAVEACYRKHFASIVADPKSGRRAMLDGEWMNAATRSAKVVVERLAHGGKGSKAAELLKRLRPQRAQLERAHADAERVLPALDDAGRSLLESNLIAQQKIMLGLLTWAEHVFEASLAVDAGDTAALQKHVAATREGLALIESGKALASRGEFQDWYRGDRKMNLAQLAEWSGKLAAAAAAAAEARAGAPPGGVSPFSTAPEPIKLPNTGLPPLGKLAVRHARDIQRSSWSIGGETLDRDFTVYEDYEAHFRPLGAKGIRLQAGWAKCEKKPGVYDWAWLHAGVDDAIAQGVQAWLETSYGNTIYPGGGGTGLGGSFPHSPEALAAWDNWVRARVRHFQDRVHEWDIWNKPDLGKATTAEEYSPILIA